MFIIRGGSPATVKRPGVRHSLEVPQRLPGKKVQRLTEEKTLVNILVHGVRARNKNTEKTKKRMGVATRKGGEL